MNIWWVTVSATLAIVLSTAFLPILNNWNKQGNFFSSFSSNTVQDGADLIVTNGTIFTSDESMPFAQSMAVRNGRVIRVGNYSSIQVSRFFSRYL